MVEKDDLDLVFGRFERLEGGLMGFNDFGRLVADLKLGLREGEVKHLFLHLAEDASINSTALQICEDDACRRLTKAKTWAPGLQRQKTEDARINVEQFLAGIRRHRFLRRIVSHYAFPDLDSWSIPVDYDWKTSTQDNYGVSLSEGFVGALAHLREHLDANWHGNYNAARQRWQDAAVHRVVATDDDRAGPTKKPWLVYTCGPVWKSSLSHFAATTRPCYRHAIEQASRRWRGGSTRRNIDVHAGAGPWARARAGS